MFAHREGTALAASMFIIFTLFGAGMYALGHHDALNSVGRAVCGSERFTFDGDFQPVCDTVFGSRKE